MRTIAIVMFTLALAFGGGCRKGRTGVDLPRYPGSQYAPADRMEYGSYVLYGALLSSSNEAANIIEWYDGQLKDGWTKEGGGQWGATYTKNMELRDGEKLPTPKDPTQKGGYVSVAIGGSITLYESVPKTAK